jgi:hypothetical protein
MSLTSVCDPQCYDVPGKSPSAGHFEGPNIITKAGVIMVNCEDTIHFRLGDSWLI